MTLNALKARYMLATMRVITHAMPYFRLMRLHQPVGTWLLLWPCWWALALNGTTMLTPYILFALGAVAMRSSGCIINDMADREIDRQVERTRTRPLASGEVSMCGAFFLLFFLLVMALCVAGNLGKAVVLWGLIALIPVSLYPFMKRITWWPQLFLGATFNWGALMGFAAAGENLHPASIALYTGGIFWTLGYDTIYAHQDKVDDARIGVKSTALYLGDNTRNAVSVFYALAVGEWLLAAYLAGQSLWVILLFMPVAAHFIMQARTVDLDDPESCRRVFKSNSWLGALVFGAYFIGAL